MAEQEITTTGVTFSQSAASRIARATKAYEDSNGTLDFSQQEDANFTTKRLWGVITDRSFDTDDGVWKHAWSQLLPTKNAWQLMPNGIVSTTDDGYALNVVTNVLSADTPPISDIPAQIGAVVEITTVHYWDGVNAKFAVQYLFSFTPNKLRAQVINRSEINGKIRWLYTIAIGHRDMSSNPADGGDWVVDDDNNGAGYQAFSRAEEMNTFAGSGIIGTGNSNVSQSDGTIDGSDCAILGIPVGDWVDVEFRGADTTQNPPVLYYTIIGMPNSSQSSDGTSSGTSGLTVSS